ncbi:MAG TPA: hypothetical protein VI362_02970 [Ignavibacteriaceae bacterium]|nr:hypothetical protein [Ignavibacteriaceae bacterium]
MKILIITDDAILIEMGNSFNHVQANQIIIYNSDSNPLSVVAFVFDNNPSLLIVDDDYLKPNSAQIIETIRKMNKNLAIVFVTSDPGLELGKEISQLGILYYAIKPLVESELGDLLNSINNSKDKITY